MEGRIFINGQIGSFGLTEGVELLSVVEQVKKQPQATSFVVDINSEGGVVSTGFEIYNYLKNLSVPVTTVGKGIVASIATVIFMAGEKRILKGNTNFMVHLPKLRLGEFMQSDEVEQHLASFKEIEKQMLSFYSDTTAIDVDTLKSLIKEDTFLTPEQAISFGFVTEHQQELQAVAFYDNINFKTENMSTISKEDKSWLEQKFEAIAKSFKPQTVALMLQDSNGAEVNFPDVEEGSTPAIGDIATVDGAPAEGDYVMPSLGGVTVKFAGGEITEIIEAEEGISEEEAKAYKEENERLKAEMQAIQAAKVTAEEKSASIEKQFVAFKSEIVARFDVEQAAAPAEGTAGEVSTAKKRLLKLKNKNK